MLAIITARGGSKRIPKKNIKDFFGKPVIAYAIETALQSGVFEKVMVSTDSQEIAEVAKKYGAEVPFLRSEKNSDDYAGTADVLLEVIDSYNKNSYFPKNACCIYPITPLITKENHIEASKKLIEKNLDVVMTIAKFEPHIQRCLSIKNDLLICDNPQFKNVRTQDLEDKFYDAGQFYYFNVAKLLQNKSLLTANTGFICLDSDKCQDVDTMQDWRMLEMKYRLNKS